MKVEALRVAEENAAAKDSELGALNEQLEQVRGNLDMVQSERQALEQRFAEQDSALEDLRGRVQAVTEERESALASVASLQGEISVNFSRMRSF